LKEKVKFQKEVLKKLKTIGGKTSYISILDDLE